MKKIISTCIALMVSAACSISAFAMEVPTNTTIQDLNGVRQYIPPRAMNLSMVLNTIMAGAMQRTTSGRHYPMECPAIQVSDVWKRFDFLAW